MSNKCIAPTVNRHKPVLYYAYCLVKELSPIYPVYLLLFESANLSLANISLLLAIWSIPVVALELPTGILADHWNRKYMLCIGVLLRAGCFALWAAADGFALFAAGFVLWGVGEAFGSGSAEALLYDNLKRDGIEDEFDRMYGKGESLASIGTAISMVSGGFLAMRLGMRSVLTLSIVTSCAACLLALGFREVNLYREERRAEGVAPSLRSTLTDGLSFLALSKENLLLALTAVLVVGTSGIFDEYDQLIASGFGLNLTLIGLWGGFRLLLEAAGAKFAYRLKGLTRRLGVTGRLPSILAISLGALLCLLASSWSGSLYLMPLYGLFFFAMASARIIQEEYLQSRIEDEGRSTVHSALSLAHNGYAIAFFACFSRLLRSTGILAALSMAAAYVIALVAAIGLARSFPRGRSSTRD